MALAIIGGMPERFAPLAQLYRHVATEHKHDPAKMALSINSHGFIADTREEAIDVSFPGVQLTMNKIGRERGWPPMRREQYEASAQLRGSNFVGSPDDIIEKLLFQHSIFNHQRFTLQLTVATMPHDKVMRAIELLGTKVAPVVRQEIAQRIAVPQS
jgi:alkanesulfonate monooxygenase SsuD/methylene tetrahydromethanopterin reductase-like flavin-dependent oxidoreductase (luciferase family)